jgi:hypothetical protein
MSRAEQVFCQAMPFATSALLSIQPVASKGHLIMNASPLKFANSPKRRALVLLLLAAGMGSAFAQDPGRRMPIADTEFKPAPGIDTPMPMPGEPMLPPELEHPKHGAGCPNPVKLVLVEQTTASPHLPDFPSGWNVGGAVFNQTSSNKHFGHTFRFDVPKEQCCKANPGRLTVTFRALGSDTVGSGGGSTGNDGAGLTRNGAVLTGAYGHIWAPASSVTAGQITTKHYIVPAGWVASGRISFVAQDDTAVVKAVLQVSGCCLTPTQPEK